MQYRQLCAQKLALRKKKKRDNSYSSKNQSPFVVFAPAPCVNVPPPPDAGADCARDVTGGGRQKTTQERRRQPPHTLEWAVDGPLQGQITSRAGTKKL